MLARVSRNIKYEGQGGLSANLGCITGSASASVINLPAAAAIYLPTNYLLMNNK